MSEQIPNKRPLSGAAAVRHAEKLERESAVARGENARQAAIAERSEAAKLAKVRAAEARDDPGRHHREVTGEAEDALRYAGDRLAEWALSFNRLRGGRQVPSAAIIRINLQNVINELVLSRARPWLAPPPVAPTQRRSFRELDARWVAAMCPPPAPATEATAEEARHADAAS